MYFSNIFVIGEKQKPVHSYQHYSNILYKSTLILVTVKKGEDSIMAGTKQSN